MFNAKIITNNKYWENTPHINASDISEWLHWIWNAMIRKDSCIYNVFNIVPIKLINWYYYMPNIREIKRGRCFFNTFIMYCMMMALAQCIHLFNKTAQFLINYIQTNIDTISAQAIYNIKFLRFSITPLPLQSQLRIVFSNDYIGRIITNPLCSSVCID